MSLVRFLLQEFDINISHYFQVSGEIPSATPDNQSVRTTSGPLGSAEKRVHSLPYIDPSLPGMVNT